MNKFIAYLKSFYTRLAFILGAVMYATYALSSGEWGSAHLIIVALVVCVFLPYYTKISEWFERYAVLHTGQMFLGKIIRFSWQYCFNLFAISMLLKGGIVDGADLDIIGGLYGAVALTTFSSQGMQYVSIALANRDVGNHYMNVTLALGTNVMVSALASMGIVWIQYAFIVMGVILGFIGACYSLVTDIMGHIAPKGGVGVFFGTFNPAHKTHMAIVQRFMQERKLSKVYIHPTGVPRMHAKLLKGGIIRIAQMKDGMRIYDRTEKADAHIDYFPTGNKFFEVENRLAMLKAIVKDYNMEDKVEVIYYPEDYEADGFYAVIRKIRAMHPGERIHGLHGSDYGGMLVRAIYDESLGIWPYAIVRKDDISATAVRNGASNMTSESVARILDYLKDSNRKQPDERVVLSGTVYRYNDSRLLPEQETHANESAANPHVPVNAQTNREVQSGPQTQSNLEAQSSPQVQANPAAAANRAI